MKAKGARWRRGVAWLGFCAAMAAGNGRLWGAEAGFVELFDGHSLAGWQLSGGQGPGYGVTNEVLFAAKGGGGKLMTTNEYADFVLRFEFRLDQAANNGVGIRAPYEGDAAYNGMEIQILEDTDPQYANLRPAQYHGSIYDVFPAKRGAQRPVGEWNEEEITAIGRHVAVVLNGQTILDANLNDATNRTTLERHPGLLRERGHIGWLGHNDHVEFRNVRIKEVASPARPDNAAPEGFEAVFNGRDLTGWEQAIGGSHWRVENGSLAGNGPEAKLTSSPAFTNFELSVEARAEPGGEASILYGDRAWARVAESAGGANGGWNRYRIMVINGKPQVFLNGEPAEAGGTSAAAAPAAPGKVELRVGRGTVRFKNIYVRPL